MGSPTNRTRPVGERRPSEVGMHGREAVVRCDAEFGRGEHLDDAGHPDGIVDVDGVDDPVGDVGSHEHRVELCSAGSGRRGIGGCP